MVTLASRCSVGVLLTWAALALLVPVAITAQADSVHVTLVDGVIVDRAAGAVYVMAPDHRVKAVDLGRGTTIWSTKAAAKPLALRGALLVAQTEPARSDSGRLDLVVLDTRHGGRRLRGVSVGLPQGTNAGIDAGPGGGFVARGHPIDGDIAITWEETRRPLQGIRPVDDRDSAKALGEEPRSRPDEKLRRGAVQLDATTGEVAPTQPDTIAPTTLVRLSAEVNALQAKGTSFLSADGSHVLVSERVADDRVWDKYRWTIYERETRRRVGAIRIHLSAAPFVVYRGLVVFPTEPFTRRGQRAQPLTLRAFNLTSGSQAWGVSLRDIEYRGTLPP